MKKQILSLLFAFLATAGISFAQGGGQRQTPEEKTNEAIEKMATLKMDVVTQAKAKTVLSDFYQAQQTMMEEMRSSGNFDRDLFGQKRKELASKRDENLKMILTQDQMRKWMDDIEPGLRPQRRQN